MTTRTTPDPPRRGPIAAWGLLVALALVLLVEWTLDTFDEEPAAAGASNPFSHLYHAHLTRWTALRPASETEAPVGLGTPYESLWSPSKRLHGVSIGDQGLRRTGAPWLTPVARTAGTGFRILVLGDSAAFGFFVDDHETYAALLPELARERGGHRPVETLNAGVPGYTVAQGLLYLEDLLDRFDPDLVVLAFGTNDARPAATRWPARYEALTDRELLANLEITTALLDTAGVDPWAIVDAVPAGGESLSRIKDTSIYQALAQPLVTLRDRIGVSPEHPGSPPRVPVEEFEEWLTACIKRIEAHGSDAVLVAGTVTAAYRAAIHRAHGREGTGLVDSPAVFHSAHASGIAETGGPLAPWRDWIDTHLGDDAMKEHPWLLTSIDRVHPGPAGHALLAHAVLSVAAGEAGPGVAPGLDRRKELRFDDPAPVLPLLEVRMLESIGERAAAMDSLDRLIDADPGRPALHRLRGWLAWRADDFSGAAQSWSVAMKLGPEDCELSLGVTRAWTRAGRPDRALAMALDARRHCDTDPRLGLAIGEAQLRGGHHDAAVLHLEEGLRGFPRSTASQLALGRSLSAAGRTEDGISALQSLVRTAPQSRAARAALELIPTDRDPDGTFEHESGMAWLFDVHPALPRPRLHELSTAAILEDGLALAPSHSHHQQIRDFGEGRYSHWGDVVFFSTSDGTDPNKNGRTYRFVSDAPAP